MPGCLTFRLPDITSVFLPKSLVEQYDREKFLVFTKTHVRHWTDNHFDIFVTWSERFRAIKIAVAEIEVVGNTLRIQNQYRLNRTTNQFELIQVPSPLLAIKTAVTEIEVVGNTLRSQNQYRLNLITNQYDLVQVPSPLLGSQTMDVAHWRSELDDYVEELLRKSSSLVPDVCFQDCDCTVESDFLRSFLDFSKVAVSRVCPSAIDEFRSLTAFCTAL